MLREDFENYLIKKHLLDFGADYRTISIIGPQSSGKSESSSHTRHVVKSRI